MKNQHGNLNLEPKINDKEVIGSHHRVINIHAKRGQ